MNESNDLLLWSLGVRDTASVSDIAHETRSIETLVSLAINIFELDRLGKINLENDEISVSQEGWRELKLINPSSVISQRRSWANVDFEPRGPMTPYRPSKRELMKLLSIRAGLADAPSA